MDDEVILETGSLDQTSAVAIESANGSDHQQKSQNSELLNDINPESGVHLGTISSVVEALRNIKAGGEIKTYQEVLRAFLEARDDLYLNAAQSSGIELPNIERHPNQPHLYKITGDDDKPIWGSAVAIIDAQRSLSEHRFLLGGLNMNIHGVFKSVDAEETRPAVSGILGSRAQGQPFPGDLDVSEYIKLRVENQEDGVQDLVQGIKSFTNQSQYIYINDKRYYLHPVGVTFITESAGKSAWSLQEINKGEKLNKKTEEMESFEQFLRYPLAVPELEFMVEGENGEIFSLTKQLIIQVHNGSEPIEAYSNQQSLTPGAFNEIYFDDPTEFGLANQITSPEAFVRYLEIMNDEFYMHLGGSRFPKAVKRLYNYTKTLGDLELSAKLRPYFGSEAARIFQQQSKLLAFTKINDEGMPEDLVLLKKRAIESCYQVLLTTLIKPENILKIPPSDLKLITSEVQTLTEEEKALRLRRIFNLSESLMNKQTASFLVEFLPDIEQRLLKVDEAKLALIRKKAKLI